MALEDELEVFAVEAGEAAAEVDRRSTQERGGDAEQAASPPESAP